MRRFIALLMGGVVLMGPLSSISNAANIPDEHWTPIAAPEGDGWRSLFIGDNTTLNREPSTLYAEEERIGNTNPNSYHCATVDSEKCIELKRIQASAFLQPCSIKIPTNCIESFYAISAAGKRVDAVKPINYPIASKWDYEGDEELNLPTGGTPTVWTIPGINHGGGGTNYMVQAFTVSGLEKPAKRKITTEQFNLERLVVNVVPVSLVTGQFAENVAVDYAESPEKTPRGVIHNSIDEWRFCAMVDNGTCQKRQAFPDDVQYGVKIRLQKKISGWLHGRIYNPDATIVTSPSNSQTIEVVALPIRVPVVGEWFKWSELTPAIRKYVLDGKVVGGQGYFSTKSQATGNFQEMVGTSGDQSFDALSLWLPQIKDRASANPSTWTFYNLGDGELADASRCIRGATDLVGMVTTNASVYGAGTPSFNAGNQSLDYKVMAPHYTSKGEIFKGTYDLRIRSEVARCIYGFSAAPIQASISVLSEDGTMQRATQTVNEDKGWLSLSAKGFTYSSPTIRVRLAQRSTAATPTAPVLTLERSITCVKTTGRKTVKKQVTAVKPTCPRGFKKVT